MKKLLWILVFGLLWCNVGFADDFSKLSPIDKMYENCTSYTKLIRSGTSNLSEVELYGATLCNEYFKGLDSGILHQMVNTLTRLDNTDQKDKVEKIVLGSCMGDPKYNVSNLNMKTHLIKLFIRYVEDNPKKIKEIENKDIPDFYPIVRVVDAALREKYPC